MKKHSYLKGSSNNAFNKLRLSQNASSSQEPRPKGLAHLERYEENRFLRERVSKSHGKARDYLQEMKQNREKRSSRKKSMSLFNTSIDNVTIKSANAGKSSLYNQDVFATMRKNELSALEKLQMLAEHQKDLEK